MAKCLNMERLLVPSSTVVPLVVWVHRRPSRKMTSGPQRRERDDSTLHRDGRCGEGSLALAMKILFLHGWTSVPGGVKPTFLAQHGHEVINPKLPDEDFEEAVESPRRSSTGTRRMSLSGPAGAGLSP